MKSLKLKTIYKNRPAIKGPDCVMELSKDYRSYQQECFVVYYLDSAHKVIAREICTIGLLSSCQISPMEVFKRALVHNARAVILSHNHPSGDVKPSKEDYDITRKLKDAGRILGIEVLDHVIVAKNDSYSIEIH